jgi:hypothetical protein
LAALERELATMKAKKARISELRAIEKTLAPSERERFAVYLMGAICAHVPEKAWRRGVATAFDLVRGKKEVVLIPCVVCPKRYQCARVRAAMGFGVEEAQH